MDPRGDRPVDEDLGLDRGELGGPRAPGLGRDVAGEREEGVAVADLGRGEAGVELARLRVVERAREQAEPFGAPALDHREHEQAIEQPQRLGLADVIAQRDRVIVAEVVRGGLLAARHQLGDLDDVAGLVVGEPGHRGDEIGALGIAADQRQRRLRRLALAVQVIGVDGIEIAERDADPARIAGHEWQRITEHGRFFDHGADDVPSPAVKKESKKTADSFAAECLAGLDRAKQLRPQIIGGEPSSSIDRTVGRTIDGTLASYNELLMNASASNALAGLMSEVHPEEAIRDAARECEQEVARFYSDLALDRDMYDALAAVDVSGADPDTQRFHAHTLRDYRRAGVDKSPEIRARLKQIDEELTKLGQAFSKHISEDVRAIDVTDPKRLAGLPEDFIASHRPGKSGAIRITTDYPDYNPFMTYAADDELRKELYIKFRSRGDHDNERVLQDILTLRAEKAELLGYRDWADYVTADKMIGSGDKAAEFIAKVWKLAAAARRPGLRRAAAPAPHDRSDRRPRSPTGRRPGSSTWSRSRATRSMRARCASTSRTTACSPGCSRSRSEIFDLRYVAVEDADVWHPSVVVYDVVRGPEKLGRIYLDMHPREGKYKHAAQFPLKDGVRGVQFPEGVLVCNFTDPALHQPALMEHDDVVTMFHEFGHLMHHVLGGHQRWITQSGVATEWDFVEAPSQMFEEWAWNAHTLARFARHHETGEIIPEELVAKMRRADKFGLGTATVQQIFYAAISLGFHRADPAKLDQLAEIQRLQQQYTPFAYVPGTKFHASFGHLVGYSAMYYTYQWSLVIAKDLLTPFEPRGLMATDVTFAYRDRVLAPGGSRDAAELVRDFLGRDYNFRAYERYLVESA